VRKGGGEVGVGKSGAVSCLGGCCQSGSRGGVVGDGQSLERYVAPGRSYGKS